jgi:hypothetical protein
MTEKNRPVRLRVRPRALVYVGLDEDGEPIALRAGDLLDATEADAKSLEASGVAERVAKPEAKP